MPSAARHPLTASGSLAYGTLVLVEVRHVTGEESRPVEQVDPACSFLGSEAVLGHRQGDQVGDANARRAGTEDHDLLVDEPSPGNPYSGQRAGQTYCRGALDVVVEGAESVAVLSEDPPGGGTGEVLPVQDRVREAGRRAAHERIHEGLVLVATHPGPGQSQVARVVEQLFAVGADVQTHSHHPARVDARCDGVDRELADGDVDPADTPVADPKDRLCV